MNKTTITINKIPGRRISRQQLEAIACLAIKGLNQIEEEMTDGTGDWLSVEPIYCGDFADRKQAVRLFIETFLEG